MNDARELFESKCKNCIVVADYHAKRRRFGPEDTDDFRQACLLRLWVMCLAWVEKNRTDEINCLWVVLKVMSDTFKYWSIRREWAVGCLPDVPDRRGIYVNGVYYTMADAELPPEEERLSIKQAAKLLGLTKSRVQQIFDELGGVRLGKQDMFIPRSRAIAEAENRGVKGLGYHK